MECLLGCQRSASVEIINMKNEHHGIHMRYSTALLLEVFIFDFLHFLCQTPLISQTSCPTMWRRSQGHPPSQRSLMLPRAVSRCHGNRGKRRAPQCPPMSLRPLGMSMTYGLKPHLVTPNFHGSNRCGGFCGRSNKLGEYKAACSGVHIFYCILKRLKVASSI